MAEKKGKSIYYQECRNPKPDNRGRFSYHPHFKSLGTITADDLIKGIAKSQWANEPQMRAVFAALENYVAEEVSNGYIVHVANMFKVQITLRLKKHKLGDDKGTMYTKSYFAGAVIPASDVEIADIDVRTTKAFKQMILDKIEAVDRWQGSSARQNVPDDEISKAIDFLCETENYVTVKSLSFHLSISKYSARKILNQYVDKGILHRDSIAAAHVYKK